MNEYFRDISCITNLTIGENALSGKGVIVAVIDSGIDYFLPEFINENGKSRILAIWDQSAAIDEEKGNIPPSGYKEGVLYTREKINEALAQGQEKGRAIVPHLDLSGHGSAVAAVAAGRISGVATAADLVIVKMGNPLPNSFPRTTQLMRALNYVVNLGVELDRPIVVNLSFGNTYGDHFGNSLLERFIDNVSEIGKTSIIIGSGNEGNSRGHTAGTVSTNRTVELAISEYETSLSVQIWKYYQDVFNINIISPGGKKAELNIANLNKEEAIRFTLDNTQLLCYLGKPLPYTIYQEIFIDMIPLNSYIDSGIWRFGLEAIEIVTGEYRFYLPSYAVRNAGTGFYLPTSDMTITIPSTARRAITVGAYDPQRRSYADFSGRGYVYYYMQGREDAAQLPYGIAHVKPDLVAPGVNISVPIPGGGYEEVSGTSFATPFVTGAAALLMEWGVIQDNDPYLYGERMKAHLIKGARKLSGTETWPNAQIGWGTLCVTLH